MAKHAGRPEADWNGASLDQVADLRAWALGRTEPRHAEGLTAWLLSLATTSPVHLHRHQRTYYRRLLGRYGHPRVVPGPRAVTGAPGDATAPGNPAVSIRPTTTGPATTGSDGVIRFRRVGQEG